MKYKIADETVVFESSCEAIRKRFECYESNDESDEDKKINIDLNGLNEYRTKHSNLSTEQCELLYSLQQFFCGLMNCNKLLIHASALVINDSCYLFTGYPDVGKTYFASKLVSLYDDAYILNDDRTVIGFAEKALCAWSTPWSKIRKNTINGIPVYSIYYIEKSIFSATEKIGIVRMIDFLKKLYPVEVQRDVADIFQLLISNTNCYLIKNDMSGFDVKKWSSKDNVL